MAINACLKLGDIKGESSVKPDQIDVLDWHWGITQSGSAHFGTGAGTAAANVSDITITKRIDKATPILYQSCHQGKDQKTAVLTFMKASGDAPVEYLKVTMSGTVMVSAVQSGQVLAEDVFTETVSLNFSTVLIEYTPQSASHIGGGAITAKLDIAKR